MYTFEAGVKYGTIIEVAEKAKVSVQRLKVLCAQTRILGAVKVSNVWLIPLPLRVTKIPNSNKSNAKVFDTPKKPKKNIDRPTS